MTKTKSQIGKASRAAGGRFELKVRKDLEDKGWIVSKWMNNVELLIPKEASDWANTEENGTLGTSLEEINKRPKLMKLIPARHKFRGPGIPMAIGTGFPDFIAFKREIKQAHNKKKDVWTHAYDTWNVIGVESKSNGYLDKVEKEKCKWLLDNNVFSKILIAKKGTKRGEIEYVEFRGNKL